MWTANAWRARIAATVLAFGTPWAGAQSYPAKPIRLVVPFPAAGAADILARSIGQELARAWGQQVVVDNRPGAGGNIGAEVVAKSPPDGYTLLLAAVTTHASSVSLYSKLPYNLERDLVPITLAANVSHILLTHPSLPVRDIDGLIKLARASRDPIVLGTGGNGSATHLGAELLMSTGAVFTTLVPPLTRVIEPFTVRLVDHTYGAPGSEMALNPLTGPLNNWKVTPFASVGPIFVTSSVPLALNALATTLS